VATPSYPAPPKTKPGQPTALSAVFQRIASEPAPPPVSEPPPRIVARSPQPLGFAEPVAKVPPIEDFLPESDDAVVPAPVKQVAIAKLEPPSTPQPEPSSMPEPTPIRARVRDLPPVAAAPAPVVPERPQSVVGRLGRRLAEPVPVSPKPTSPTAPQRPMAPPPFDPLPEPTQKPPADFGLPSPLPGADHAGRPSLPHNRRNYRRAKLPAEFEIDGVPCTLIDVSVGGFAASGVPPLEPNTVVPVTIRLTIDGIEAGTQVSARIIYVTQGRSSGRFVNLSPSQMAFLRYIVTWRGESIGAVGTTTLLDAIAGGLDRGFAPGSASRSDAEPKSSWWAGLIGHKVNPPR
jgi:PilZ domain